MTCGLLQCQSALLLLLSNSSLVNYVNLSFLSHCTTTSRTPSVSSGGGGSGRSSSSSSSSSSNKCFRTGAVLFKKTKRVSNIVLNHVSVVLTDSLLETFQYAIVTE